ncbi:hypothetical protein [Gandjariella thermophila]|uniref:hypothetical protein n=1 Tax=Gandjariella thermophila TaxID=1931992 RepID=UPI0010F51670|nr:hypothetical protein [Gandjariella thermophila]
MDGVGGERGDRPGPRLVTSASASASHELPVVYSGAAATTNATLRPDTAPAGANDWSCRPGA